MTSLANPIDMESFEDAVHGWFSAAIDCLAIWSHQSAPRPNYPYGTLNRTGLIEASASWEERTDTDLTRTAGEEIRFQVSVPCTITINCQTYVGLDDSRDPTADASLLMSRAKARLNLPTVQDALGVENIAVIRSGAILNPGAIINDAHVSRASMEVQFGATLTLEEYTGYIKTVEIKSTELGVDQIIGDL